MPAPKRPNTAAATEAVRRRGQETMAAKLREAGWLAVPPEEIRAIFTQDWSAHEVAEWLADKTGEARAAS